MPRIFAVLLALAFAAALVPAAHPAHAVAPIASDGLFLSHTGTAVVGSSAFFGACSTTYQCGLWKSDGTTAGTVLLKEISDSVAALTSSRNRVFFTTLHDGGLWSSDGTPTGTIKLTDVIVAPGFDNGGMPYWPFIADVNGTLFFVTNSELWKSDGTVSGTVRVKVVTSRAADGLLNWLTNVNGTLFFNAYIANGATELWKSDGSAAGTVRVKAAADGGSLHALTNVNGTLFFCTYTNSICELWKSNGIEAGTVRVKAGIDANPYQDYSPLSGKYTLTNVNGTLFFAGYDRNEDFSPSLWRSDGTEAGTKRVTANNVDKPNPIDLIDFNGTLFFQTTNDGLRKSDGTSNGTQVVRDDLALALLGPNTYGGRNLPVFTIIDQTLFFAARDGTHGFELWKSDGTHDGTMRLTDINPGKRDSLGFEMANVNGRLLFEIIDDEEDNTPSQLWVSDGTVAGTHQIAITVAAPTLSPRVFLPLAQR